MEVSVGVVGEVVSTLGSVPYPPADSGSWSSATIVYSAYQNLSVRGSQVIHEAKCTFVFSGLISAIGTPVTGQDTVTLTAKNTALQSSQNKVLVDGDMAESNFGNKLEVFSSNPLRTN